MKKVLFVISILFSTTISSQDSIPKKINAVWVEPEVVFETKKEEVVEEELGLSDVESIQRDLQFLEELPKSYEEVFTPVMWVPTC